ncbi:MAG: DNA repair protein RadC [Polyangiaceae bacterium]
MMLEIPHETAHLPRERAVADGVYSLGDAELLALLLGTGQRGRPVIELASGLIDAFDGLDGLARAGLNVLADAHGVGLVKALRILGGIELGRRFVYRAGRRGDPMDTSASVFRRFQPVLGGLDHEEMWVVAVDAANQVRGSRRVALGGVHACAMLPRDILRAALAEGAIGAVIVHNHPSGNSAPSMDDILMTKRFMHAADIAGVTLVDHVILGRGEDYSSMLDLGLVPERIPASPDLPNRPYGTRLVPPPGLP